MSGGDYAQLVAKTEGWVRQEIAACDASHDWVRTPPCSPLRHFVC